MYKPQHAPALKSIPPEIRLCIYQYLLRTSIFQIDVSALTSDSSKLKVSRCTPPVSTAVLRVCKLFHQEAQSVLFLDNIFQFLHPLPGLCSPPPPASSLTFLRNVIIGPFQSTAKRARSDIAATRFFVRSACPRLETLSSRHWLVKHTGAYIDVEQDFAPVLDTTYHFDIGNSTPGKQPLKYTMGLLRLTEVKDKPIDGKTTPVDIYSALYPNLVSEDERATVFDIWARVSTKCLLNLVQKAGEGDTTACKRSLKNLASHVVVDSVIEMDWRSIANDLGQSTLLL